jgi:hypothetical protein
MNDDLKQRLAAFLDDWRPYKDITGEQALAIILDAIDAHGYAIVSKKWLSLEIPSMDCPELWGEPK